MINLKCHQDVITLGIVNLGGGTCWPWQELDRNAGPNHFIINYVLIMQDITERKPKEDTLR